MKKSVFILLIVFFGCAQEQPKENILPEDKFVSLLVKMNIIEGELIYTQSLDPSVLNSGYKKYIDLFSQYKTDSNQVAATFNHYLNQKEKLLDIYKKVLDSLTIIASKNSLPK